MINDNTHSKTTYVEQKIWWEIKSAISSWRAKASFSQRQEIYLLPAKSSALLLKILALVTLKDKTGEV